MSASRTVDEWVAAVRAAKDDNTNHDGDSCISLSDALPPLPQQYTPCRDHLYHAARDALLSAAVRAAVPSTSSSSTHGGATVSAATSAHALQNSQPVTPPTVVALVGPHGVGKTLLATELVHDVEICQNFADGVAWIQLGSDINDEELAETIITCVDTIIAGDFRSTVRHTSSLDAIVARASRLLQNVSSLIVIDDVSGDRARRAFKTVVSILGVACVALYTAPVEAHVCDPDSQNDDTSKLVSCVATIDVQRLDPSGTEAMSVFRNWLTKTASEESRDGSLKHPTDQNMIITRCYGLPLALAMAGGFLSKFHNCWSALAASLASATTCDETIFRIMRLLHTKGGLRFEQQLKAIGSLPSGMWVSLSALADLWSTDYRTIKLSARRLGRMAFGEYRLSDTSDDSRVRFHWHVVKYCAQITNVQDERDANRRLLTNLSRRRPSGTKSREKIEYLPWWSGVASDKYMCRRLHWHMARGESLHTLQDLICDYQWICRRLENDSLIGVLTEMRLAMSAEHRNGRRHEMIGIAGMMKAIEDVAKMRREECIEMNAMPTFLVSQLRDLEESSECVKEFLTSIYEKARRPWLKPMGEVDTPATCVVESASSDSMESEPIPQVVNCIVSSTSGKVVCGDGGGNVYVYDPPSGKNVVSWTGTTVGGDERWRGVGALGTIQNFVISGHYNGRVLLRSIRSGRTELLEDGESDGDKITCIGCSDYGIVVVGCHLGKLYVLKNVHDFGSEVKRIDLEGHCHMVTSLYIFPDGERIASSSYDGFAAIWRLRKDRQHERISLNGHKPDIGHKENYITTFASVDGGKRLLSSCRGGIVSAWNSSTGECLWTRRYGFEFSRSSSLQAFGVRQFAGNLVKGEFDGGFKAVNGLKVGYPYMITRGEGPRELLIVASGEGREILAAVPTEQVISTWLEVWHPGSRRVYVAVSHADGRLCCYELVTSLR